MFPLVFLLIFKILFITVISFVLISVALQDFFLLCKRLFAECLLLQAAVELIKFVLTD